MTAKVAYKDLGSVGMTGYSRMRVDVTGDGSATTVAIDCPLEFLPIGVLNGVVMDGDTILQAGVYYDSSSTPKTWKIKTSSAITNNVTVPVIIFGELSRRDAPGENPQGTPSARSY